MFYWVVEEAEADGRGAVARLAEERKLQLVAEAKELKRKHNRQRKLPEVNRKPSGSAREERKPESHIQAKRVAVREYMPRNQVDNQDEDLPSPSYCLIYIRITITT
jgi:hypothetical protein